MITVCIKSTEQLDIFSFDEDGIRSCPLIDHGLTILKEFLCSNNSNDIELIQWLCLNLNFTLRVIAALCTQHYYGKEIAHMLLVILMYILVLAGFAQIDKLGVSEDHSCEISCHSTTTTMINRDFMNGIEKK